MVQVKPLLSPFEASTNILDTLHSSNEGYASDRRFTCSCVKNPQIDSTEVIHRDGPHATALEMQKEILGVLNETLGDSITSRPAA